MKRILYISLLSLLITAPLVRGQDSAAAAIASRQEAEENYKSLKGHVDDLIAAQADQERKLQALAREVAALREQLGKPAPNNNYATQEETKHLADAITELDQKRKADNEKIVNEISRQIAKLGKLPPPPPPARIEKPAVSEPATSGNTKPNEEGYTYEVKPDDNFSKIAAAYREQGVKVTWQQIAKANPTADSSKLKVGQKIFIPASKADGNGP